ncbi:hypothetical protein Thermus77412_20310 [Thermus antranikianii]
MAAYWQRTGDPLGDFVRLTFLVEEALERLGADRDGTLGEKLKAVETFLAAQDSGLLRGLWELVRIRNQVIHARTPVPEEVLNQGSWLVSRLLLLLEKQGYYDSAELSEILGALKSFPPPPPFHQVVIEPAEAQAPPHPEAKRPLEIPRRGFALRPLLRVVREAWWRR